MTNSDLQQTINDYRDRLEQSESAATQVLQDAHAATIQTIQPALDRLYEQIREKMDAGEEIPLSWLYEQNRLETIEQLISGQISEYAAMARMITGSLQNTGARLGQDSSQELMQGLVPQGVNWSFGVPMVSAIHDLIGALQPGSPLYTLFNTFGPQAGKEAAQALIAAVSLGMNPNQIASMIKNTLTIPLWRGKLIARTEMLRSYRSAQLLNYRKNSDVVGQWRWTCALGANTCEACLWYDGQLFPLDEDMDWQHPNCRCSAIPVTKSWEDILGPLGIDTSDLDEPQFRRESGMEWFTNQDEDVQRQILGAKYDGWAKGEFSFKDMVGMHESKEWGDSIYVKSLKELLAL
jgi:SPP1 gp7 family putative phage head morphogenesis protein